MILLPFLIIVGFHAGEVEGEGGDDEIGRAYGRA